ncbi:hypothetical protein GpartN1_g4436.t1 [Galdieria partita]|uniref:Aminotransferase class I/classII large domain-containing protein n=1 Tax=Galdieria partita TaxID=83374 RepID=A0A9C7PY83_9RHOD|nr:hypothetical protein GpartN1_g4436.t1 [Galdieria partita]
MIHSSSCTLCFHSTLIPNNFSSQLKTKHPSLVKKRFTQSSTWLLASTQTAANPMTRVPRNPNLAKLEAGYLFPEIAKRKSAYLEKHPTANIISLGIGDTTQPIPAHVAQKMAEKALALATPEGYSGYGPDLGDPELRKKISERLYGGKVDIEEIFVSDGAKCDIGRLQMMFGSGVDIAVQDPSYPVYVDSAVIVGQTGTKNGSFYENICYMTCLPENNFFPQLDKVARADIIFFCSPNNPTGAAATREQLEKLVQFAKKNGSIIVYDAAYAPFIRDENIPQSIFEVEGANEVALECNSFSKYAGFTGVRLGWIVCPKSLQFADGTFVHKDFRRIFTTCFNGASSIAQAGGLAVLDDEGMQQVRRLTDYYLENARILSHAMQNLGLRVFGGENSPYVWVQFPGRSSWEIFEELLEMAQLVTVPGSGFGPGGESFLRLSAFASREHCLEAKNRLESMFGK